MSEAKTPPPAAAAAAAAPAGGGGIKALLPLILTVVMMPVLAYVMTAFVLVPKLQQATVHARAEGGEGEGGEKGEGAEPAHGKKAEKSEEHGGGKKEEGKKSEEHGGGKKEEGKKSEEHGGGKKEGGGSSGGRPSVQFGKVLVNVAGSLGSRYLLTNFTLIGKDSEIKDKVETNKDQLMDMAIATLRTKTIQDLEKPGAANLIRTELMSVFNGVLGNGTVKEIFFTEFAIQ